ncbi:MAG: ABC transporter permease subunit [Litoreibacter sp.]
MDTLTLFDAYSVPLLKGLLVTMQVSLSSFAIGVLIATFAAPLLAYARPLVRFPVRAYVDVFRGLPELLVIFLFFYGGTVALTSMFGHYVEVSPFAAGIAALSLVAGAYLTEIFRAALVSVNEGQWEAAYALGLSPIKTFILVVLPQTARRAAPGMANQWLVSLKESALVSVIGLEELMRTTVVGAGSTQRPLEFYLFASILYLLVTSMSQAAISAIGIRAKHGRA